VHDVSDELNETIWTKRLLDWLHFAQISDRESEVDQAHEKTFRWALQPDESESMLGPILAHWLRNCDGLFWIQGKLGSGKSTLMKYVWQSPLLEDHLCTWAKGKTVHRASFFFWKQGASDLQRSLQGLYRTLLASLIGGNNVLARIAFPDWHVGDCYHQPTAARLQTALSKILKHKELPHKYCFFIDGLDEYEEKNSELQLHLAKDMIALSKLRDVKIVVSSRPEAVFVNRFMNRPTLRLQDLTANDIKAYVEDEIGLKMSQLPSPQDDPTGLFVLAEEVVARAEGVFLWVVLVVADLVIDISNMESYACLRKRLDKLQDDLNTFFRQILVERIDPEHRQQVARHLLIAKHKYSALAIHAISSEVKTNPDSIQPDPCDLQETLRKSTHLAECLPLRSRGLLSTRGQWIELIHSSMHEFLDEQDTQSLLQEQAGRFSIYLAIAFGLMAHAVVLMHFRHEEYDPQNIEEDLCHHIATVMVCVEIEWCRTNLAPQSAITCLERLLATEWEDAIPQKIRLPPAFLPFSIQNGCTYFLRSHIESGTDVASWTQSCPLLCYTLEPTANIDREWWEAQLTEMSTTLGFQRIGPLGMLLQAGADPNEVYEGRTPWGDALRLIETRRNYSRWRESQDMRRYLYALRSATAMLCRGADPDLHVLYYSVYMKPIANADIGEGPGDISTQIFAEILNEDCCKFSTVAECTCEWARSLRPPLLELVELVEEKKLEKRLGPPVHLGRLGIYEDAVWSMTTYFWTTLVAIMFEFLRI
jgi:hypothetical protein